MHVIDENQLRMDSEKANSYLKSISFMNNYLLKPESTQCEWTDVMFDEYENCMDDYMYFITRHMKIVQLDRGIITFEPYEYQKTMIRNFYENRFSINLCPRQCGKSTIATAFILHYILFNENKTVAILANKQATAVEILDRIKLAYENLPKWMQHGIRTWNKTEIVLENGCKIGAYSSSSSAIRGMSINCLKNNGLIKIFKDEVEEIITIGELSNRLKNNIFENFKKEELTYLPNIKHYKVLTESGYQDFDGIKIGESNKLLKLTFDDNSILECTYEHLIKLNDNSFKKAVDLDFDDITSSNLKLKSKEYTYESENVYDLVNVTNGNEYITNNVTSHNCVFIDEVAFIANNVWEEFYTSVYPVVESGKDTRIIMVSTPKGLNHFYKLWKDAEAGRNLYVPFKITWRDVPGRDEKWRERTLANTSERAFMQEQEVNFLGSSNTLFDMNKIQEIVPQNPIIDDVDNYTKIYEEPIENHTYIGFVDVSEGKEQDSSVIQIFDITQEPYKQVAVFCSNTISLMLFPFYINQLGKKYNDAYLLVENNSIGTSVTNDLFNDFEYENILYSFKEDGKIYIDDGQDDKGEMGIKMTKSSKKIGCNNIKEIFENGKLLINDMDTISQMSTFIRLGTSYAADPSAKAHDDLITPLIHMGFLIKQRWFKDLLKEDVRANIAGIKIKNEKMFLGFKQRGSETENLTPVEDDPFANWDNISSNNYTKPFNKNNYPNLFLKR